MRKRLIACFEILTSRKYLVATQDGDNHISCATNFENPNKILYRGGKFYDVLQKGEWLRVQMRDIEKMRFN